MIRQVFWSFAALAVAATCAGAQTPVASASKVKATATATKPGADGKQTVTVVLDIARDCIIYANKVGLDFLQPDRTRLSFTAKEAVAAEIMYPPGRRMIIEDLTPKEQLAYHVYDGTITLQANVQRKPGDHSPLTIEIRFRPMPVHMNH